MARPRSAGFELQREQMLAAAAQLFASRGYTATTMSEVAAVCGVSKATLYHYVSDKHALLAQITRGHVVRLEQLVQDVHGLGLPPQAKLQELIVRFMQVYADAQNEHRVLTEDLKFLADADRSTVKAGQRRVVAAFADTIALLRPDLRGLHTPLAMLLFGMINWTFTWLREGDALTHSPAHTPSHALTHALTHASLAPRVVQLFLGGLPAVQPD